MVFVIAAPEICDGGGIGFGEYRFDAQRGQRGGGDPDHGGAGRGRG